MCISKLIYAVEKQLFPKHFLSFYVSREIHESESKQFFKRSIDKISLIRVASSVSGLIVIGTFSTLIIVIPTLGMIGAGDPTNADKIIKLAAVLASLSGFLFAIISFTINLASSSIPGARSFVRDFAHESCFLPALIFILGSISGMIGCAVFGGEGCSAVTIYISGFCVIVSVILMGFLLFHSVNSLDRKRIMAIIRKVLINQHLGALKEEIITRIQINLLMGMENELKISFKPIYDKLDEDAQEFNIQKRGQVTDISLQKLEKIVRLIKRDDESEIIMTILPGEEIKNQSLAMVVTKISDASGIEPLIRQVFILSKPHISQPDWEEFGALVINCIKIGDINSMVAAFQAFRDVVEDYLLSLKMLGIHHSQKSFFEYPISRYMPPDLSVIDFRLILKEVVKSANEECIQRLKQVLVALVKVSWDCKDNQYYDMVIQYNRLMLEGLYSQSLVTPMDIYNQMKSISVHSFGYELDSPAKWIVDYEKKKGFPLSYAGSVAAIQKLMIESGDFKSFGKILELYGMWPESEYCHSFYTEYWNFLDGWRKYNLADDNERWNELQSYLEIEYSERLLLIALGGWCLMLAKLEVVDPDNIRSMVDAIYSHLNTINEMMSLLHFWAEYESNYNKTDWLKFDRWQWGETPLYTVYSRTDIETHMIDFWIAVSLRMIVSRNYHYEKSLFANAGADNFLVAKLYKRIADFSHPILDLWISSDVELDGVKTELKNYIERRE